MSVLQGRLSFLSHNWLVYRISRRILVEAAALYARGTLVDIGCGKKQWEPIFGPHVTSYIGVDHADAHHGFDHVDVVADAYETTLDEDSADTVILLAVLEHLEEPGRALREVMRILRPGGHVVLTAPLFWQVHEAPRDFFRYTEFGLRHLIEQAGLEAVEIRPMSGFVVTFAQATCYVLHGLGTRVPLLRPATVLTASMIQTLAYAVHRFDPTTQFTWMYLAVGRCPDRLPVAGEASREDERNVASE